MDDVARRWARLKPTLAIERPAGKEPFPVVLIHPGCGGVRTHLDAYARAAAEAGWMGVRIESFAARGWSESFTRMFVCRGLLLRGRARAGDVLASVWGAGRLEGADSSRLALAGWSHGSWAIMDLMAMRLNTLGDAGLADPWKADLRPVRGAFLAYPYIRWPALAPTTAWRRSVPRVLGMAPGRDHLATVAQYRAAFQDAADAGAALTVWTPDANHAFDEPGLSHPKIRHDPEMTKVAIRRFAEFLISL